MNANATNALRFLRASVATALLAAALCQPAHAGRSCDVRPPTPQAVQRGLDLAQRTADALDASGADVVVLARAGQDLSKHGLRWSHIAFAYRDAGDAGDGRWRIVHKLNLCGAASADVYRQGLGEFFLDDPFEYRAAFVVLTPAAQALLKPLLVDNGRVAQLNEPAYNMLAYPWSQRYQQSNQWALETLALGHEPAALNRERAQAWLRLHGYEPTVLHIDALTRLGARLTRANIAFDDHPNDKRFSDRIETVSADSVFDWLQRSGLGGAVQQVR